jgi:hypothetical protein
MRYQAWWKDGLAERKQSTLAATSLKAQERWRVRNKCGHGMYAAPDPALA